MSKYFNALAVAVLGIALLMGAASATTIAGDITETFAISATPADKTDLALNPASSPATHTGTLSVNANAAWTVTAGADSGADHTKGYMSEWTGTAYKSAEVKLGSPMEIKSDDTGYTTLQALTTDRAVAAGSTSETGHVVTFSQPVAWNDQLPAGTNTYQIIVTFTIA